jgi:hypothetical protein
VSRNTGTTIQRQPTADKKIKRRRNKMTKSVRNVVVAILIMASMILMAAEPSPEGSTIGGTYSPPQGKSAIHRSITWTGVTSKVVVYSEDSLVQPGDCTYVTEEQCKFMNWEAEQAEIYPDYWDAYPAVVPVYDDTAPPSFAYPQP